MTDYNVANPGNHNDIRSNFESAVASAVDGDTIIFPAGTFTFGDNTTRTSVVIKEISIKGAGNDIDGTIIYRASTINDSNLGSADEIIDFQINASGNTSMIIEDVWWKSKKPRELLSGSESEANDTGLRFRKAPGAIVRNCRFDYFGARAIFLEQYLEPDGFDNSQYLVYNNIFNRNIKAASAELRRSTFGYGVEVGADNNASPWVDGPMPDFGTEFYAFIEDNLFIESRHNIASNENAMYVGRYNKSYNVSHAQPWDFHGTNSTNVNSANGTLSVELYKNLSSNTSWANNDPNYQDFWDNSPDTSAPFNIPYRDTGARGGQFLSASNESYGYQWYLGFADDNTGGPPANGQVGYFSYAACGGGHSGISPSEFVLGDGFIWDNIHSVLITASVSGGTIKDDSSRVSACRDYHLRNYTDVVASYVPYTYPHPWRDDTPPASTIYDTDVVSWFKFDGDATDSASNNNALTFSGSFSYDSSVKKRGTHSVKLEWAYGSIPSASIASLLSDSYFAGVWVQFISISASEQNMGGIYDFRDNERAWRFGLRNRHWVDTVSESGSTKFDINYDEPVAGSWYHIGTSFNHKTGLKKFYLNGQLRNTRYIHSDHEQYESVHNSTADFLIGGILDSGSPVNLLNGYLDNFIYCASAITDRQVEFIYNYGLASAQSNSHVLDIILKKESSILAHSLDFITEVSVTTQTDTHILDFITQQTRTNAHTLNFVTQQTQTNTYALDFIAQQIQTNTHTLDFIAQQTVTQLHILDFAIQKTQINTHTLDFIAQQTQMDTYILDFVARQIEVRLHTLDFITQQTETTPHTLDFIILQNQTSTYALDTIIVDRQNQSQILDFTTLSQDVTKPHILDVRLLNEGAKPFVLDFILKQEGATIGASLDFVNLQTETLPHVLDTVIVNRQTNTSTLDFVTRQTETSLHTLDFITQQTQTNIHTLDFITQQTQTNIHTLDFVARQTETSLHTLDFVARQTQTNIYTLDFITQQTQTDTYTLDFIAQQVKTHPHILDVVIVNRQTNTYTLDYRLVRQGQPSFILDFHIRPILYKVSSVELEGNIINNISLEGRLGR